MRKILLILTLIVISRAITLAQFTDFHPELNWYTIEGKYVSVHYHDEAERTAKVVAKIGDEVWEPITSLYQYDPGRVHYVIKDIDDYSNGATFFFDNKIEIWASSMDFDLRGTHNWLRNVISHEFTHMVQIQAAMKVGRSMPALFLQHLNYEDKRRPDILYGFPNVISSYPLATINIPAWLAEGTAQYMRKEFNYDNWDSHRDMILRSYALDNKMLTWNQMGVFGKTSLGNESVYNSGFALARYIAQKYGEEKLKDITYNLGKFSTFTVDKAIEESIGISGKELYKEWSSYVKKDYQTRAAKVLENKVEGNLLTLEGDGNFYPQLSRDGKKMVFISNKGNDYFSLSSIFEFDFETKKERKLSGRVRSTLDFIPGQDKIIYAKLSEDNPGWTNIHDLYIYDINTDEEVRITEGLRANNPDVSPDGKYITFTFQQDGTINLGITDIDGKNFKKLTFFENGEQIYYPKFSDDSKFITFDYSIANGRDIAIINIDGSGHKILMDEKYDVRNAKLINNKLYYSSDETGIFNLYRKDITQGTKEQLTNVTGGAFMSDISDNKIIYAGYTSSGYKLFELDNSETSTVNSDNKYEWKNNPPLNMDKPNGDIENYDIAALKDYNDKLFPEYSRKKYSGEFTRLTFMPFIRFDNYNTSGDFVDNIKPGVYVLSNDMLNRFGFFAGASINKSMERDLFLIFEYRNKLPILYSLGIKPEISFELYSISRKSNVDIFFGADTSISTGQVSYDYVIPTDVTYNLFEADFVLKHRIFGRGNNIELRYIYSKYTSTIGSFKIPNESILYPSMDDTYLIGKTFRFKYTHELFYPHRDATINPIGRKVELEYNYENNQFNNDGQYEISNGFLKPNYNDFKFHRLELNWKEHLSLANGHTLTAQLRAGTIFGPAVPDFFDFYLGGIIGMKSYPFYAISGNEVGWVNLTYRFPLFRDIDYRLGHVYLDKVFFSVYADWGNAWTGGSPDFGEFKKGIGAEIRIQLTSFYLFPTSVFFNAAYSFDKFNRTVRDEELVYGQEWNFYGGILFDFPF